MKNHKSSRKYRKRTSILLALLSTMNLNSSLKIVEAKEFHNKDCINYTNNNENSENIININKNKFENFKDLSQVMLVSKNAIKIINDIFNSIDSVINSGNKFVESTSFLFPEYPSRIVRFFKSDSVQNATDSAAEDISIAIKDMKNFINEFENLNLKEISENLNKIDFYSKNTEAEEIINLINLISKDFDFLNTELNNFNSEFDEISNLDDSSERYDKLLLIYQSFSNSVQKANLILDNLNKISNNLKFIKNNFENLPEEYNNYIKIKENEKIIKLKNLKNNFEDEKLKSKNKLKRIQINLIEDYKNIWKNADTDISILIQRNFDNEFHELENEIIRKINEISDIGEYTEENAKKILDIEQENFDEKKQKFLASIDIYKNKLNIKKENLKTKKSGFVNKVIDLKNELENIWTVQCNNIKEKKDLNIFVETAELSYNAAKNLCDQILREAENILIDMNVPDPNQILELSLKKINTKKLKIEAAINIIREKGLLIRTNISKEFINNLLKERDNTWKEYAKKFGPDALDNEFLVRKSKNIWEKINLDYNETVEWENKNLNIIKTEKLTEDLAENIESVGINLANIIGKFKGKILAARAKMNDLILQMQADLAKKLAWNRVFTTTGNYENIKNESSDFYFNKTYKHSQAIANLIDNYLPGTYENILKLCNLMRQKIGVKFVLISGPSGWGKSQSIGYLISATRAKKISINYKELIDSINGAQYANNLLSKYKGKSEPLVIVLDEFEVIAKPRSESDSKAGIVNSFFDEIKRIAEDPQSEINLKLVVCISNMNKNQLDFATVGRMNSYLTYGDNPGYKKIISAISSGVECSAIDRSKENFINIIAQNCDSLAMSGFPPSPRNIKEAIYAIMIDECTRINANKQEEDEDYIDLWRVAVSSKKVSEKITELTPRQQL